MRVDAAVAIVTVEKGRVTGVQGYGIQHERQQPTAKYVELSNGLQPQRKHSVEKRQAKFARVGMT